eukprot:1158344-Pelagomonas_calceolata.AAC.13
MCFCAGAKLPCTLLVPCPTHVAWTQQPGPPGAHVESARGKGKERGVSGVHLGGSVLCKHRLRQSRLEQKITSRCTL